MIAALAFYQLLATASFTLLGLWFVVVGLSHGGWRTDPARHRYDLPLRGGSSIRHSAA